MKNQVLNLELCKKFKELGIEIKTEFVWWNWGVLRLEDLKNSTDEFDNLLTLPAPTLSELLEIIPTRILDNGWSWFELGKTYFNSDIVYWVHYTNGITNIYNEDDKSPIEAVGKLIIYLKENNLI